MSMFEDDQYRWRETYFVLFDAKKRPSMERVKKVLAAQSDGYALANFSNNSTAASNRSPFGDRRLHGAGYLFYGRRRGSGASRATGQGDASRGNQSRRPGPAATHCPGHRTLRSIAF